LTLLATCLERRADQLARWRALGEAQCGRSETLFKVSTAAKAANGTAAVDDLGVD
jgi:hypothetical protein